MNSKVKNALMINIMRGRNGGVVLLCLVILLHVNGCRFASRFDKSTEPIVTRSILVAPIKNLSGFTDFNALAATDEFVTELQLVEGMQVAPVNAVLAKMYELNMESVTGPQDAVTLAGALGVDGIIVISISRYEPYAPPIIGIAAQLYMLEDATIVQGGPDKFINPTVVARQARPFDLGVNRQFAAKAQAVKVYDANRDDVVKAIKTYAKERAEQATPLGWKKYLTQSNYMRFVSRQIITELGL
jgi:hypothetical protein